MNSFRDFFFKILKPYKMLGITPYTNLKSSITVGYLELGLVSIAFILCWIGVFLSLSKDFKTDDLITVGNIIQFISKYLNLTMILAYPLLRKNPMNSIVDSFENIDTEHRCLHTLPNYDKAITVNNISSIICLLYLIIISIYDFVIVFIVNRTADSFLYWIIVNIPLITITFGMLQSCAVIYLIKERCELVNTVIKEICQTDMQPSRNESSKDVFQKIRSILTELGRLPRLVEKFYGPLFLITFATSFAVICIQMFYCYLIITTHTFSSGYNLWTMTSSINIIITNCVMIVSITSICECVTSEVSIIDNL